MRITINERVKRVLGDAAVLALLVAAFLATGCGIPDEDITTKQPTVGSAAVGEVPVTPVSNVTLPAAAPPASEPAPITREVTYDEAETAFREHRYTDAVALFSAYTDKKPENPWGLYMLGLSARQAGKLDLAEVAFNEALSRDPRHVKSLLNLSRVLIDTDRPDEALRELEFALEIDPTSVDALRLEGVALTDLERSDEAIETYRRALKVNDTDVWSMNNLGLIYIRRGAVVDALGPLARAVELAPDVAVFQNNLGMALERSGYQGSAADAYRAALEADEHHEKARVNLERVESRGVDLGIRADLESFARGFQAEIERWRGLSLLEPETEPVAPAPADTGVAHDTLTVPDTAVADRPVAKPDTIPARPGS